ncbi:MAG: YvrJ family protein [Solibacillus sp.]|uniref:YvrJ family protein n=1 Tax=Solibacillus sp. TaxID=1909654 RepID=UPI003315A6F7
MLLNTSELITVIGNFGFPIAITVYLFIRFEKKIENLENSILKLSNVINDLEKGLKRNHE